MTANIGASAVIHPVVVRINGYKFRVLLDSGASHSYGVLNCHQVNWCKMQVGWSVTDCNAYWKYHAEDASL